MQFNAIVKYAPAMTGKYHNISNVGSFIRKMEDMYDVHTVFFYSAKTREYVGFWKRGYEYRIHQRR